MRNNMIVSAMVAGMFLMASIAFAQSVNENEVYAYNTIVKMKSSISAKTVEATDAVDYPTISFPETAGFTVEKEKAFFHLSWQVIMREGLSYTEIQSSADGVNFTTVGFVINDLSQKNSNYDYFVPSEKMSATCFRLVQYGLNAQQHTSDIVRVK